MFHVKQGKKAMKICIIVVSTENEKRKLQK